MFYQVASKNFKTLIPLFITSQNIARFHHRQGPNPVKIDCPGKPKPLIDFNCKVALITGGSDGIGLAVAHEILSENSKNVALIGVDNTKGRESVHALNSTYGRNKAVFFNCDVESKVQVNDCFNKVIKEFGSIDIVINAAGVFDGRCWEKEIMTNLVGTIHCTLEAYRVMSKDCSGSGGVILNFSGLHGVKPLFPAPTLSASFHGIIGLSRSFGHETNFKTTGVRVVTLCPGITNTNFIKDAEKRALNEKMANQLQILLCKVKRQNADACGQSAVHVLKYGTSGSVWVVDGSKLYSLNIPDWKKYRILESQLL
ncbi:Fat body protein 2-like Protein [Tribolium castaneum]|uniref:Fat body protein 2-like Protein n=1 Tax=Tribolium castaneum TaxID=7070 RepID=A0A139WKA8_TRICA|nr:PREDICTED: 15-hydroxyprostaglandin dehydrogenase [NAD(+)]-like [Tribolium castaneum]KYB28353.1 Fat body protein 2-like Protein [Tribolium castaneum]|eukprot:XP_015834022.1 PREDICTED: 15-hydroxyprostaglandin dehydrogenase [NAD(+)]-like [Tribolium castaneum]